MQGKDARVGRVRRRAETGRDKRQKHKQNRDRGDGNRADIPSLRWWSSKAFMAAKEAAPPMSSWENLPSCFWSFS